MTGWIIAGGVVLLLLLLLWLPVSVRLTWSSGVQSAWTGRLYYACFPLLDFSPDALAKRSARRTEKAVKREDGKLTQKAKGKHKKEKGAVGTARMVWNMLLDARGPLDLLRRHLVFYRVRIYASVAREDAHQTGVAYALSSAAVHTGLAVVSELFCLRRPQVRVEPDFSSCGSRWEVALRLRIRPLIVLAAAVGFFRRFLKTLIGSKQHKRDNKGGKKHEPATSRQ